MSAADGQTPRRAIRPGERQRPVGRVSPDDSAAPCVAGAA